MLPFYKKYRIFYFVIGFTVFLITIIRFLPIECEIFGQTLYYRGLIGKKVFVNDFVAAYIKVILMFIGMPLILRFTLDIFVRREYLAVLNIFQNECNPELFITRHYPVFEKIRKRRKNKFSYLMSPFIAHAQALFEKGDVEEAISILEELNQNKYLDKRSCSVSKYASYLSLYRYYWFIGNTEDAARCREVLEATFEKHGTSIYRMYGKFDNLFSQKTSALDHLCRKEYREALGLYLDLLKKSSTNYEKAYLNCFIATIYDAIGEPENSATYLETAEALAPKFFFVTETKRRINEKD